MFVMSKLILVPIMIGNPPDILFKWSGSKTLGTTAIIPTFHIEFFEYSKKGPMNFCDNEKGYQERTLTRHITYHTGN